jgi:flavodoxin
MKTLILCLSYHHKNTEKIASVFVKTLGAELKSPLDINPNWLSEYDLVGFGSGIYFGKHHKTLLGFIDKLPDAAGKKAFIFSTSGQEGNEEKFHKRLREKLQAKNYDVVGEFNCPGHDTYALTKIVGGIKKGHPNEVDLKAAEVFGLALKQNL